ncbi:MAG: lysophospholipid acyltransferase family protein [Paracoccaceae bacterium]
MRQIIDTLIAERAPWITRRDAKVRVARSVLYRLLGYERTVAIAETLRPMDAHGVMSALARTIACRVSASGLEHVPRSGAAMIVCNHPTGIADGIVLYSLIAAVRRDLFIFANRDALRVLPQLEALIDPVEWREEKRDHRSNRETVVYARRAFEAGRAAIVFPSGRLAKRRGLRLHERPWMPAAAALARRFDLPVVPLHISARNSALFYLFDLLHPSLRDITLFHEVLNKARTPYSITVGRPIPAHKLPGDPAAAIQVLRDATLSLAGAERQVPLAPGLSRLIRMRLRPLLSG